MLTRMARLLTRMARMLTRMTRMTRWLAYYTHSFWSCRPLAKIEHTMTLITVFLVLFEKNL